MRSTAAIPPLPRPSAGSLIDSLLTAHFGKNCYQYTPDKKGKRTTKAYEQFTVRQFTAVGPIWQIYQQFWVYEGDAVPTTFSRNATAHTVCRRQFNRRNTVQVRVAGGEIINHTTHAHRWPSAELPEGPPILSEAQRASGSA